MSPDSVQTQLAVIKQKLQTILDGQAEINRKLEADYVTQDQLKLLRSEFQPFKSATFWLLGSVGIETIGLLYFMIKAYIQKGQ